jgi:predicted nucleic acid-binding protein
MRVVIDTSVLYEDMSLERADARLLLDASRAGRIELVVPEVVVLEALGLVRERFEQASVAGQKVIRNFGAIGVEVKIDVPDVDGVATDYEATLRAKLRDAKVRTPSPPAIDLVTWRSAPSRRRSHSTRKGVDSETRSSGCRPSKRLAAARSCS